MLLNRTLHVYVLGNAFLMTESWADENTLIESVYYCVHIVFILTMIICIQKTYHVAQ